MMKTIKFDCEELLPSLSVLNHVINSKNVMPILNDFRIEVINRNELSITASDGEIWLTMFTQALEAQDETTLCIEAKAFLQIISSLNDKEITMEVDDEKHIVNLKYDKGHCKLPYEDANEFPKPKFDAQEVTSISACALMDAIARASMAVGNDELRQVMNGVHFDFLEDGMVSVATDAKKLVKQKILPIRLTAVLQNTSFTLPTKACILFLSLGNKTGNIDEAQINFSFDDRNVYIDGEFYKLTSRLVEGKYPNYNAVIPKESTKFATINKEAFLTALKHVLPMGSPTTQLVALKFTTVITSQVDIIAQDFDFNKSAQESVDCEYTGEDITIGFNGQALMQLVQNVIGDKFILEMDTPQRAGVIKEAVEKEGIEYTSIIMPMLVNA